MFRKSQIMQKTCFLLLFSLLGPIFAAGQGTQVEFGKNRVQYHKNFEEWSQYESDNFYIFWYGQSRNIGQTAAQLAELDFPDVQSLLEHRINEKIQIIVYTDITDFKQSNIGDEEAFSSTAGQTKIVGSTIFVYYDGNQSSLRRQIREGIASVYLNTMLFGSNIQEVVQNAVMLHLPAWFKEGLVAFAGEAWNADYDNALRDAMLGEKYKGFVRLAEENPRLAGHAFWYYIAENFGKTTVSNLLYLTRINRSVEAGFLYVMGTTYEKVLEGWEAHFRGRFLEDRQRRENLALAALPVKNRKNLPVTQIKLSPDGRKLAYATNKMGRFRVALYDFTTTSPTLVFKGGQRNPLQATDYNYPLIAWNPNNTQLSVLYEFRDDIRFATYDLLTGKTEVALLEEQYQRVYDMDFVDPFSLVFAASASSQSDLFLYYPRTRQSRKLTNDFYDEQEVAFVRVHGQKGILFTSNRPDTLLPAVPPRRDTQIIRPDFDLFYYSLDRELPECVRITRTPLANERCPVAVDSTFFAYLSDRSGIYNQEAGYLEDFVHHSERHIFLKDGDEIVLHEDSAFAWIDTALIDSIRMVPVMRTHAYVFSLSNFQNNALAQHTAPLAGKQVIAMPRQGKNLLFAGPIALRPQARPSDTYFQRLRRQFSRQPEDTLTYSLGNRLPAAGSSAALEVPDDTLRMKEGLLFQARFGFPDQFEVLRKPGSDTLLIIEREKTLQAPVSASMMPAFDIYQYPAPGPLRQLHRINLARITPYRLQFRTDQITTQVDNTLLFEGLDNLAGNPNGFSPPPAGLLIKGVVKDLFEDYQIRGGVRIPTTFNGAEYFAVFDNKKNRLDHRFAFYTKNSRTTSNQSFFAPSKAETNILIGQYGLRYPLDVFQSLRATTTLRRDRFMQLATDQASLNSLPVTQQRIGLRLEYVFDNTLETGLNLRTGVRARVMGEVMQKFSLDNKGTRGLNFPNAHTGILGLDARFYQPVLKYSLLAARLAATTSFGSEKMLYYLGGVDNWLLPEQNRNVSVPPGNFVFQTLAANMRGFPINVRNGNSYALINTELRVPLFRYFSRRLSSAFLRNFQLTGFFDVGTAWAGSNPFRDDNPLNTETISEGQAGNEYVFVTINYFRDPIVAGYGVGARLLLFGYFVRVDYGWGIETRSIQKPRLHIAMGFDF